MTTEDLPIKKRQEYTNVLLVGVAVTPLNPKKEL
jgi:hypothetical protein